MGEEPAITVPVVKVPLDNGLAWYGASAGTLDLAWIGPEHLELVAELVYQRLESDYRIILQLVDQADGAVRAHSYRRV